jgi:hypothetical protein
MPSISIGDSDGIELDRGRQQRLPYESLRIESSRTKEFPTFVDGIWWIGLGQGCQMVYFRTKNPNLGKFLGPWNWKGFYTLWAFRNILRTCGIFFGHFNNLEAIGYIFLLFGLLCQEKSGNPGVGPVKRSVDFKLFKCHGIQESALLFFAYLAQISHPMTWSSESDRCGFLLLHMYARSKKPPPKRSDVGKNLPCFGETRYLIKFNEGNGSYN